MLPAHDWDDPAHRTAIHTAFELWSLCWESGDRRQAARWKQQLKHLTNDAQRRALLVGRAAIPRRREGRQCFRIWPVTV